MSVSLRTRPERRQAPERERRVFAIRDLEVRAADTETGAIPMSGYAAVFGSRSHILWDWWEGSFVEEVERGAFSKTIENGDVRLLINHNPDLVLARSRSETLTLSEDDTGLRVEADMAPTTYAQDLAITMRRGDVTQMSFMFRVIKDEWAETEDGLPLRRLLEVHLFDTSVVTFPAYEETEASARGLQFPDEAAMESFLADLITRELTPAQLPRLRAARTALEARLSAVEPYAQHSTRWELMQRTTERNKRLIGAS